MKFSLKREYSQIRDFYRAGYKSYLQMITLAFILLVAVGTVAGIFLTTLAGNLIDWFSGIMEQSGVIEEDGGFNVIALFFNNFRAMLMGILYGLIPFLFFPAVNLGFNALIIGIMGAVYIREGFSPLLYLSGILPHGIFEIPALLLSISCGIYLCRTVTDYVRHNEKGIVKKAILNILRLFLLVIVPLLLIAAVIECYVTPLVMNLFL